ncbi:MAG: PD-(D/E)XK nuclease family protein [Pyrinomonadaceae bacterium]
MSNSKQIWLGPLLSNNRAELLQRCAQLVACDQGDSFLYIAASHPLLELATGTILDGLHNRGVWGELPVYLFRGFVKQVLTTAVDQQNQHLTQRFEIDAEELPLKRSLIAQILRQLSVNGKLTAIAPLANREGCVNSISTLIGEIQRAAKTPEEFAEVVAKRERDFEIPTADTGIHSQIDFDRDVSLIYSVYAQVLKQNNFTDADADQLQALHILRGDSGVSVPWLANIRLLVIDGFFDFTPVQGEMLRHLIRHTPEVIVNLNSDARNPTIFQPFRNTIEQLQAITEFELRGVSEVASTRGALSGLRERLFKPVEESCSGNRAAESSESHDQNEIELFICSDRETEIRKIAKEIKRLVLVENYNLNDIGLVVRERASYAEIVARVMHDEGISCVLEERVVVADIPAVKAARKLFEVLSDIFGPDQADLRISDLADLIKSEYVCLSEQELKTISTTFADKYGSLLTDKQANGSAQLRIALGIERFDVDSLENTIAFVGSALSVTSWLERARKLIANWSQVKATTELATVAVEAGAADEESDQVEDADIIAADERGVEKKRRPSSEVHPAAIGWASLVLERMATLIRRVHPEGTTVSLRRGLLNLLDQLQFPQQVQKPARRAKSEVVMPQALLDLRGLEALRRALLVAVKSIDLTEPLSKNDGRNKIRLSTLLGEVSRALQSEIPVARQNGRGLRVLEATDVRGLRFRALFVAGLIEGGFPLRGTRDWIYPHEERERLKRNYDLTLEDISPAVLLKEEHYFYQTACRTTDKLFLSRPSTLEDGTQTIGSYYIDELKHAIYPVQLKTTRVMRDVDGKEIADCSSRRELVTSLVRQDERRRHRASGDGLMSGQSIAALKHLARLEGYLSPTVMRGVDIERERAGDRFGIYDGKITAPALLAMLKGQFGPGYVHSASGLSNYGNCSYRFFVNRVLQIQPRGEAALDLQAIDAGKLLHDILRRFFEIHRGQHLHEQDRDKLRAGMRDVADRVFKEYERAVPPLNPDIWKIDCEIRKVLLDQVLLYELSIHEKTRAKVVSKYFEVAFGMTPREGADPLSKPDYLELDRSTGVGDHLLKIRGQIDRVDEASDGTLVAYDYKLSMGAGADDMKAGRSLQLPIYLEALERLLLPNRNIAGGGYYILRPRAGRRNSGIYRKEFADYLGLQARNSILSESEWHQLRSEVIETIWSFIDRMRSGDFRVRPSLGPDSCKFCDYSAVCRYERFRIDWKSEDN